MSSFSYTLEAVDMKPDKENILRQGRLGSYSENASEYTSSTDIDGRLLQAVVKINSAHVVMLVERKIIERKIAREILSALQEIPGDLKMSHDLEDVHMNVESFVISKIGKDLGGMMNLAKSRNDQVATALRMTSKLQLIAIGVAIVALQKALLDEAMKNAGSILPGYTHLQRGQPVTLGHHLLAHFDSLDRNFARLVDCYLRTDLSPMGAGALSSTGFNISRERIAELLGFESILENSLDAVSSRDFATEAIYLCAETMTDLSRLSEEMILWTTKEFSFAEMADEFTSTSSMMPQKKNAIVPEIFRARTAQVIGDFVGAMGIVKSLPLSYNLDLQELTRNLWSAMDKASFSISILADLIRETKFDVEKMSEAVSSDEFIFATELADHLVQKYDLSFREAHSRVARLVKYSLDSGKREAQFTSLDPKEISEIVGVVISKEELASIVDPAVVLSRRSATGAPNPKSVLGACKARQKIIRKHEATLASFKNSVGRSDDLLDSATKRILANGHGDVVEKSND